MPRRNLWKDRIAVSLAPKRRPSGAVAKKSNQIATIIRTGNADEARLPPDDLVPIPDGNPRRRRTNPISRTSLQIPERGCHV